jgi:hypothetical protein
LLPLLRGRGSFFCGLIPLIFAAILFFSSRNRAKLGSALAGARIANLASLHAGKGLEQVHGRIAPRPDPIDGSPENALVYTRMKVEYFDTDDGEWKGMADKLRGISFKLEDDSGEAWVVPDGLDIHLLGKGYIPDEDQMQAACILPGIQTGKIHARTRFTLWELRAGQQVTVIGPALQNQSGIELKKIEGKPFIINLLTGQEVDTEIGLKAGKPRMWAYILGIPGAIILLSALSGAPVNIVRAL